MNFAKQFNPKLTKRIFCISFYLICLIGNVIGQHSFNSGNHFELDENGKWGIKSTNGEWIVSPRFENEKIEIFENNYAIVKYKRMYGVIDDNGNWKISPKYDTIFKDRESGYWRIYLDRDVGVVFPDWVTIEPQYSDVWIVCNGIVQIVKGSKIGFAFENGKIIEPYLGHLTAGGCGNDCYKFAIDRKYGLVFTDGTLVPPNYAEIVFYNKAKNIIAVKNNDQYYFVDFKGNPISKFKFDRIRDAFDENGFCLVIKDNRYGYMRDDGFLIEPKYKGISKFINGEATALLSDDEKIIIDMNGNSHEEPELYAENDENSYSQQDSYMMESPNSTQTKTNSHSYNSQSNSNSTQSNYNSSNEDEDHSNKESKAFSFDNNLLFWIILIACVIGVIIYFVYAYSRKCNSCKKWNAMKTIDKVCTGSVATTITKTEKTKNSNGDVIATREVHVPATSYHYDVYRKCKYCHYEDVVETSETHEN